MEDMLTKQIPGTDIRALPHINSKITMWKRNYSSIRTMLDSDKTSSGIGINTTTGLIDCTDEQWERVVKRDPSAATMRLKTWPMFEDWIEVFGNDRATGKTAENVYEAFSNLEDEEKSRRGSDFPDLSQGSTGAPIDIEYNMETEDFIGMGGTSQTAEPESPPVSKTTQRKRSVSTSSPVDPLVDVLGKLVTTSNERLGNLVTVMGYEAQLGKARKEIFDMLEAFPFLTLDQKIDVSKVLAKDSGTLEMFLGFTEEARARYVIRLINGDVP